MNRVLYHEWFPQILYNHHQSGPAGTVVYSPPLRDPYNYNLDPCSFSGSSQLGAAMHTRLAVEGQAAARRCARGGPYDGWWNGGIRNTATFHNIDRDADGDHRQPDADAHSARAGSGRFRRATSRCPIAPQEWHFRQSIDYSHLARSRGARLRVAHARELAVQHLHDGQALDRARQPGHVDGESAARRGDRAQRFAGESPAPMVEVARRDRALGKWAAMHAPDMRDPRGYIIPSDQADFPTATKFVNALLRDGHHRAARDARLSPSQGKQYPAGSYVVQTAQAFRPHVMDMFEPQVHPDVIPYPGATADAAVRQRGLDARVSDGRAVRSHSRRFHRAVREDHGRGTSDAAGQGAIARAGAAGYVTSNRVNDSFIALNRLLKSNEDVVRLTRR